MCRQNGKCRWKGVFITYHSSNKEKRQFNTIKLPDLIREFSTYLPNSPPSFSTAKSNESSLEQELSFVKWLTRCGPEAIAQILKSDPQKLIWIYNRDNGDFRDNLLLEYCK